MSIGITELLLIAVIAIVIINPTKLPQYLTSIKAGMKEVQNTSEQVKKDFSEAMKEMEQ